MNKIRRMTELWQKCERNEMKNYWAGFVNGKVYTEYSIDTYGEKRFPALFTNKKEAEKRFQDVRKVEVKEQSQ